MKQSLKYGLLLIVTLLLHSILTEAAGDLSVPAPTLSHNKCIVSQARPMRQAVDKFYLFCSPLSCDVPHADLSHVPTYKNLLRLATHPCGHLGAFSTLYEHSSRLYTHNPEDPIMHYIYGQRKIVI